MSDLLHHFVEVRQSLTRVNVVDNRIEGRYRVDNNSLEVLQDLENNNLLDSDFETESGRKYIDGVTYTEGESEEGMLTLRPYNLPAVDNPDQRAHYFENVDELINKFTEAPPSREYYVHGNVRGFSSDSPKPDLISKYEDTTALIQIILSICDFERTTSGVKEIYFFRDGKVEIPIKYEGNDIRNINNIQHIHDELEGDEDGTRREVLVNTLEDHLKDTTPNERLASILNDFSIIYEKYRIGYKRYLRKFSYENLKSSFVRDRANYIKRLKNTVNNVQNKLITVPLAFLLVGGQLESSPPLGAKNVVIFLGSLVFSIILYLLIDNQKTVLEDVESEIEGLKKKYKEREPEPPSEIKSGFKRLDATTIKQKNVLNVFDGLVFLFIWSVLSLLLFYVLDYRCFNHAGLTSLTIGVVGSIIIGYTRGLWRGLKHLFYDTNKADSSPPQTSLPDSEVESSPTLTTNTGEE